MPSSADISQKLACAYEEVVAFRHSLTPETDRGCAIAAAAYLDRELELLHRATQIEDNAVADSLFKGTGGLASFSSRIDLAYLRGLISKDSRFALHLIRKIRNDFAHSAAPLTFERSAIANRCRELIPFSHRKPDEPSRSHFVSAVFNILADINTSTWTAVRPNTRASEERLEEHEKEAVRTQTTDLVMGVARQLGILDTETLSPSELDAFKKACAAAQIAELGIQKAESGNL